VIIATPDHQHCGQLMDAVQAGKDAYVEKPIAVNLDELNKAYDVVMESAQIVQNGTQGRSSAGALTTRNFLQEGKLGKIIRIEESRSQYYPYWNHYEKPESEKVTDWEAFLFNQPDRPFDPDQHGSWMGYKAYSPNTIGGWMSHMSDFIHYVTGADYPVSAIAHGGIYSPTSHEARTCPDTVTAILDYAEGFSTLFTTHFGNGANNYDLIFGSRGTMRINPPDGNDNGINPRVSGEGSEHPEKLGEETKLELIPHDDHMVNFLKCIVSREQPNAHMGHGHKQGVAVLLAEAARVNERKMKYDKEKREICPA
jgi:predicted dehydrogenase